MTLFDNRDDEILVPGKLAHMQFLQSNETQKITFFIRTNFLKALETRCFIDLGAKSNMYPKHIFVD